MQELLEREERDAKANKLNLQDLESEEDHVKKS